MAFELDLHAHEESVKPLKQRKRGPGLPAGLEVDWKAVNGSLRGMFLSIQK